MNDYRVYKYALEVLDAQRVRLPFGAVPLSVQEQNGELQLWALVDTANTDEYRYVYIVGTGNPIGFSVVDAAYIGTVQTYGGRLVWHVFVGPDLKPVEGT